MFFLYHRGVRAFFGILAVLTIFSFLPYVIFKILVVGWILMINSFWDDDEDAEEFDEDAEEFEESDEIDYNFYVEDLEQDFDLIFEKGAFHYYGYLNF